MNMTTQDEEGPWHDKKGCAGQERAGRDTVR